MNSPSARFRFLSRPATACAIAVLLGACAPHGFSAQPSVDDSDFVSLFNGRDLTGWEGSPDFWRVQDGAITAQTTAEKPAKGNTFLIWKGGEVKNFELRATFRLVGNNSEGWANSGIQYRSRIFEPSFWVIAGYQADMDGSGAYVGQLYEERGRGRLAMVGQRVRITDVGGKPHLEVTGSTTDPAAVLAAVHQKDWNEYVVIAEGNHLRQFVNGILTADVTDLDEAHAAKSGLLALQLHAGLPMTVQFKSIRLKTLP